MPPLKGLILSLAWALSPLAQAAAPFLSPPGVAQRALGGTGAAGPGSLASVWHNPATLVDAHTAITAEWQAGPGRGGNGALTTADAWFAGVSYVNRDKFYGTVATGIASYTPHIHKLSVTQSGTAQSAYGRSDVITKVIGVPYAVEFDESGLALGVVGELVTIDPSGSDLRVETEGGSIATAELPSDEQVGMSAAFGMRYALHRSTDDRVDFGGVVRTPASSGASLDIDSKTAAYLMPDKPGGYDLGLRWRRTLADAREIAAQVQLATTDWGDSGSVRRYGVGTSLRTDFAGGGLFRGGHAIWRAGYSRFVPDEARAWMDWPEGSAFTVGVSFEFTEGTHFDLALERRTEERDAFDDDDAWLLGVAFSLGY